MRRRTGTDAPKKMSAENRRKSILETTMTFISQFGFWGFTIRDVAQAQGITEAGLLYYFKNKEDLMVEALKYADHVNQIAIAKYLGVEGVSGDINDGITYHCDYGLRTISTATAETNANRRQLVSLYVLLQGEALSEDHPAHEYFQLREKNVLKEYAVAAARDHVSKPERTAIQVLGAMDGLQLRWLSSGCALDFAEEWRQLIELIIPDPTH